MGVLHDEDRPQLIRIEDIVDAEAQRSINYADYIFDDTEGEEEAAEAIDVPSSRKDIDESLLLEASCKQRCKRDTRRGYRLSKREKELYASDGLKEHKNMGMNKLRRIENARLLLNYANPQDIYYDGSDIVPKTMTAFSRLFINEENMKAWNEFIELDEADQLQILDDIDEMSRAGAKNSTAVLDESFTNFKRGEALRSHHPAFSAQACFNRLDKNYRKCFMKNRNLPLSFLEETEEQLRNFFESAPHGVYVEALKSKMKRFYFHAMAQFLSLTSKSFVDDSPTSKIIQVTNGHNQFTPPSAFLVTFIQERRRQANPDISFQSTKGQ